MTLLLQRQFSVNGWRAFSVFPKTESQHDLVAWASAHDTTTLVTPDCPHVDGPHGLKEMRNLRRIARRIKPSVVNLHYGGTHIPIKDVLSLRTAMRRPLVVSVHHPSRWSQPETYHTALGTDFSPPTVGEKRRRLTGLAARFCDAIIVNSAATMERMIEAGIPRTKLRLIPCGVPTPSPIDKQEARKIFDLNEQHEVISCVASLIPQKGTAELLAERVPQAEAT